MFHQRELQSMRPEWLNSGFDLPSILLWSYRILQVLMYQKEVLIYQEKPRIAYKLASVIQTGSTK